MPQQEIAPVRPGERIEAIDIVRGFALFGILIVNYTVDAHPAAWQGITSAADQVVFWPIEFLMNDRFLSIYCFLFGLGAGLILLKKNSNEPALVFTYLRRLLVLYIIGLAHWIFLVGNGTALIHYATYGVLLLIFRKLPVNALPFATLLLVFISWTYQAYQQKDTSKKPAIAMVSASTLDRYVGVYERGPGKYIIVRRNSDALFGEGPTGSPRWYPKSDSEFFLENVPVTVKFYKGANNPGYSFVLHRQAGDIVGHRVNMTIDQGEKILAHQRKTVDPVLKTSYLAYVRNNIEGYNAYLKRWSWLDFFLGQNIAANFGVFLLGFYVARKKYFADLASRGNLLRKYCATFLIAGIALYSVASWHTVVEFRERFTPVSPDGIYSQLVQLAETLGIILMSMGYIAALCLLLRKEYWKKKLQFLAPVGRMGLTNYLLHAVPWILITRGFGLGMEYRITMLQGLLLTVPVGLLLYGFSKWWLRRFSYGPAEWLWRSLTYWKLQPIRNREADRSGTLNVDVEQVVLGR